MSWYNHEHCLVTLILNFELRSPSGQADQSDPVLMDFANYVLGVATLLISPTNLLFGQLRVQTHNNENVKVFALLPPCAVKPPDPVVASAQNMQEAHSKNPSINCHGKCWFSTVDPCYNALQLYTQRQWGTVTARYWRVHASTQTHKWHRNLESTLSNQEPCKCAPPGLGHNRPGSGTSWHVYKKVTRAVLAVSVWAR